MVKNIKLSHVGDTSKLFLVVALGGGLFWLLLSSGLYSESS